MQVIVVDDRSSDGTYSVLERIAEGESRINLIRHDRNRGKGAAIATAVPLAEGDVTIIHDADLEYHADDIPNLLQVFVTEGADAVFGSRYFAGTHRRALMFKHSVMNWGLTRLSNLFTDLDLTDVETCYKAIRTPLLQSIPIRSPDFCFEVEITSKLAKRGARIFEVPIRYVPRSYAEGKKIKAWDGLLTIAAIFRFWLVDDVYRHDEYGSHILSQMEKTRRFNMWMGDVVRPYVGDRVLEIGAGVGTLTSQFIPRSQYVASDINPIYLRYLRSYSWGKPYLEIRNIDAARAEDFEGLEGKFDTALIVNVLEHISDPLSTLRNLHTALRPGGSAVVLVPQHEWLYGTLDEALDHRARYTPESLEAELRQAGFEVSRVFDFNRFSVPGWWLNGKLLKRKTFSRIQLKMVDTLIPIVRRIDRRLPWKGQSLIAIARRPE